MGSFFLCMSYLKSYKKEFKSYIKTYKKRAAFSTIIIYPSELYTNSPNIIWEDEYKEVVYKGILYDVVSIKGKGLTIELTVVSDHQEMQLKKQFASLYDIGSNEKTKSPFNLLKTFFALKFIAAHSDLSFNNSVFVFKNLISCQTIQIRSVILYIETPPPQFLHYKLYDA